MTPALTRSDLRSLEELLRQQLQQLAGDTDQLEREAFSVRDIPSEDRAEAGSDIHAQDLDLQLLEVEDATLREVLDALKRIEEGDYGRCENCASWIAKERLLAIPYARLCIRCESARAAGEAEAEGG